MRLDRAHGEVVYRYLGHGEWAGAHELTLVGHVLPGTVLLSDGGLMATIHVPGYPYEMEAVRERNTRKLQIETLIRTICDDNITIWTHLVHHRSVMNTTPPVARSSFGSGLLAKYQRLRLDGKIMRNDWFVSVVVGPRFAPSQGLNRLLSILRPGRRPTPGQGAREQLEDIQYVLTTYLGRDGARRLAQTEASDLLFSEIGEAMHLVMYARPRRVPETTGTLSGSIYTDRVICGRRGVAVESASGAYYGRAFGFREYPARTNVGMLNALLSAPYSLVLTQSFRPKLRAEAERAIYLKTVRMENAGDMAVSQIEGLAEAADDVGSGNTVRGTHHASLLIYADTIEELNRASSDTTSRLSNAGIVPAQEDRGSYAAYWSQVPGVPGWMLPRPGEIGLNNFTSLASLDSIPSGAARGYWGAPLLRFRTSAGTAYDYHPHVGEVGHTLVVGRTGIGKTVLLTLMATALEGRATTIYLDKDRGSEVLTRAVGGRYLALRSGADSGLAPLRALGDQPADRAFLLAWIKALILLDGQPRGLSPDEERRLGRAIARTMALPVHLRSLAGVRAFLGYSDPNGAGARLERWCRGGALGYIFDGEADDIALDAGLIGIDLTAYLEHEACPAVGAYLLHRLNALMDGRRLAVIADEARFYLLHPLFAKMVEDWTLTMRKREAYIVLAAQQPEHFTSSPIGASLVGQCTTKIMFPEKSADSDAYIDGLKCTEAEFQAIIATMAASPERSFLLKRDSGSVVLQLDLSGMQDEIAVLSGRPAAVDELDRIRAQVGDDPADWLPVYLRRYPAIRRREKEDVT